MNAEKNLNKNYIDTIKKLKKNSDEYAGFINSCFNSFLQFYNSREYYEIVKFKHPNNGDNINRALIMVKDKLRNSVEEFLSEAPKMDKAILEAKNKFLSETLLPYPPKLEAKIDEKITDSFSEGDIEVERDKIALTLSLLDENSKVKETDQDLIKLGHLYSKIFHQNKLHFYMKILLFTKIIDEKENFMITINVEHVSGQKFETFNGVDTNLKKARKKMYLNFLKKTKLPLPNGWSKERIESFINNLENLKDIEEVPQNNSDLNSENPSSGYKWDSENWTFEGFSAKKKRPSNLANTVINVTECGFEDNGDLYFKTFWKPHYFPGVPIDYYSPKFVYAGDMLSKKDEPIKQNEPDCRELIKACLARKSSKVRNQVEQWIEDNNFILYDESPVNFPTCDASSEKDSKQNKGRPKNKNKEDPKTSKKMRK